MQVNFFERNIVMTLKDAIHKAELTLTGKVISIFDCDDRWIFHFDWEAGTLTTYFWFCYKDTGEIGYIFPPDNSEVLERAKKVPLPD